MAKRDWDFWDILILIGALIIIFWALLKALGIISTPAWVNMLPYFGVGAAILGGVYKLGKIKRGIDETENKVDRILGIKDRFDKLEHEHKLAMDGKLNIKLLLCFFSLIS